MIKNFSIKTPVDFNFSECLRFLQRSPLECLFFEKNGKVHFAMEVEEELFLVRFFGKKEKLQVEILKGELTTFSKKAIKNHLLEWLDIHRDLSPFNRMCSKDFVLKKINRKYQGLRLIGIPSLLEAISWAIIGQQINLTFAYTLKKRLVENFGKKITFEGLDFYLFPEAKTLATLTEDALRPLQFSRGKIKYLTGVAKAIADEEFSKKQLSKLPYEDAKALLLKYKGVGNWTADYVLMKCIRCPNAFPISDVGLHNAIKKELDLDKKPTLEMLEKMSEKWAGWEAYSTFYLWHSLL